MVSILQHSSKQKAFELKLKMSDNTPVAKLVLVGDGATGKTTFVTRHRTGEFEKQYNPTTGVFVRNLDFFTTHGKITFQVWDTAGQEKFGGLRDAYYVNAHAAMIFFDVTSRNTYTHVSNWYKDIRRICQNIPMVLIGNKVDVKERQVQARQVTFHHKKNVKYFEVSAKLCYNFEKPFVYIAGCLFGDAKLALTEEPILDRPTGPVDVEYLKQQEAELAAAAAVPLPEGGDEDW